MQKVKTLYICLAIPPLNGTLYLLGESSPEQKADTGDISIRRVPGAFYRVCTLVGSADNPPIWSQGLGPFVKNSLEHFIELK